jgi:RHS repeat-associated protein
VNLAGTTVNYRYDAIGQLKVADSSVNTEDRGYTYDAAWNLNYRTNNGVATPYGVDGKNQLTTVVGSYGYDGNGNLTTLPRLRGATLTYGYDDENQLTSVPTGTTANPPYTAFVYDGLGRLREQVNYIWQGGTGGGGTSSFNGGATTQNSGGGGYQENGGILYIYDGNRVIQERDINNTPTVSYTRGNDLSGSLEGAGGIGGLLARSDTYSAGSFTSHNYYHADGNGNITYLETSAQGLAASYRYDPFGNLLSSSGSYATANTYRFSSKEWMNTFSSYYYLYRFYVPGIERWLNRDPIQEWGGINLYGFVGNNPVSWIDPLGLDIVINKTGDPVTVSGNAGSGHGSGSQLYCIIPSDGKPHGGKDHPVPMYPTREEAEIAAGLNGKKGPVRPPVNVTDIDFYDNPNGPHNPDHGDNKLPGDDIGPTTTLSKDSSGTITTSKKGVIGSYWRYIWR